MNRKSLRIAAIIPAAGMGNRMQSLIPKQYLQVQGKYILEHVLAPFLNHPHIEKIVVVLNEKDTRFSKLPFSKHPKIITALGGSERVNSVRQGLALLDDYDWILVHDAARPCLTENDLNHLIDYSLLSDYGALLATPVVDTIKCSDSSSNSIKTVDRRMLWHAMTPQMFPQKLLFECLQRALDENLLITDEASALEYCGYAPHLLQGRADNIKLTRPEDLALIDFYLSSRKGI